MATPEDFVTSGEVAKATTDANPVELIAAAKIRRGPWTVIIFNGGTIDGLFSVRGSTKFTTLPKSAVITLEKVDMGNESVQFKRIGAPNVTGVFAFMYKEAETS